MILTVYDIETNGFVEKGVYPDVYQLGFIRVDTNFRVHGSGSLYFYDSVTFADYKQDAGDVHGISESFLKTHEDKFNENIATAYAILNECLTVGKNNLSFDNNVIREFINKYRPAKSAPFRMGKTIDVQSYMGIFYREWCTAHGVPVTTRKTGTLSEYMNVMGINEVVVKTFAKNNNIKLDEARPHDALFDATLTYMCLIYLMSIKKMTLKPV